MKLTRHLLWLVFCAYNPAHGDVITTNQNIVGLEHNLLFNAPSRFSVTQTGTAPLNLPALFDGKFEASYSPERPTYSNPTVITIEGLPETHVQLGAIIGWSTRYWPADHFKIEIFDTYGGRNIWKTVADYSTHSYSNGEYWTKILDCVVNKIRYTFYSGTGEFGRFGASELFFLHPEATRPYEGLFLAADLLKTDGDKIGIGTASPSAKLEIYSDTAQGLQITTKDAGPWALRIRNQKAPNRGLEVFQADDGSSQIWNNYGESSGAGSNITLGASGAIGIGTTNPTEKLSVNGRIRAREIIVETTNWSDYVLDEHYPLAPLSEVELHIQTKKHLPGVPSAREVAEKGVSVGAMQAILLAKIEELTLHVIAQQKEIARLREEIRPSGAHK